MLRLRHPTMFTHGSLRGFFCLAVLPAHLSTFPAAHQAGDERAVTIIAFNLKAQLVLDELSNLRSCLIKMGPGLCVAGSP